MLLLLAQLVITFSLQPLDSVRAIAARRGHIAALKATACNESPSASITIAGGRIIQAAEANQYAVTDPDLVAATIGHQRATPLVQLARVIETAAPLAAAGTAAVDEIPTWGKLFAPAVMLIARLAKTRVEAAEGPVVGHWVRTEELFALAPGACQSRLLLVRWDGPRAPVEVRIP